MTYGPRTFRDPLLSVLQSAAEHYERERRGNNLSRAKNLAFDSMVRDVLAICERETQVPFTTGQKGLPGTCAAYGLEILQALAQGNNALAEQTYKRAKMSNCDPAWISTVTEYSKFLNSGGTLHYRSPSSLSVQETIINIEADARIGIVGDWGTGTPAAARVMRQLKLLDPDIIIHLGDIYYSGTQEECQINFLDVVDQTIDRSKTKVYTLCGNHDMYSGGRGYYWLIDTLIADPAYRQRASYFCLRSRDNALQFVALDTGFHDTRPLNFDSAASHIEPEEERWAIARVSEFPGRTVLLTHHQPFSAFAAIGPALSNDEDSTVNTNLLSTLKNLGPKKIAAWYWGHEHTLALYQAHEGLARGRCLGHGAIPVVPIDAPYRQLKASSPPLLVPDHPIEPRGMFFSNGFAVVTLHPSAGDAKADYHSEYAGEGAQIATEWLSKPTVTWVKTKPTWAPDASSKIAFVVGNSKYLHLPPLDKAADDAVAMREHLINLGFGVGGSVDIGATDFAKIFEVFLKAVDADDTVVLFYSGHGIQINGQSCMVLADAARDPILGVTATLRIQDLVQQIMDRRASRCLVFLDACRENVLLPNAATPAASQNSPTVAVTNQGSVVVNSGMAPIEVTQVGQVFISFAAEPGKFAYEGEIDGERPHSLYTEALLRHIGTEGLGLEALVRRTGSDVKLLTANVQRPWSQSNLTDDYFFRPNTYEAVAWLGVLGAIAGLIAGFCSFKWDGDYQGAHGIGTIFAAVVAFGVYRWGGRKYWAAALTFILTSFFFAVGNAILACAGVLRDPSNLHEYPFWENTRLLRDIVATAVAGPFPIFGAFVAGLIATPALRRARVFIYPLAAGAAVPIIVVFTAIAQTLVGGDGRAPTDFWLAVFASGVWHGLLGASFGYALSEYIQPYVRPDPPK